MGNKADLLEPISYPRSYYPAWTQIFSFILFIFVFDWLADSIAGPRGSVDIQKIPIVWILLFISNIVLMNSTTAKTTLYADRIERKTWLFKKETMLRENIGRIAIVDFGSSPMSGMDILFYNGLVLEDKRKSLPSERGRFYRNFRLGYVREDSAKLDG
jgi:exonuclease I